MSRIRIALGTLALGVALVAPTIAQGKAAKSMLVGTVGPGFTITLKDGSGHKVKKVKPGTYTIKVTDKASIHNFVLEQEKGGTFEKQITSVGFTGTKSATVTLKKGATYKYYCAPHESSMNGTFTVG